MDFEDFRSSLNEGRPPVGLSPPVEAMWWDGLGDWARAHEIAQDLEGRDAAWVHAYLHRKEGDAWNAGYWYRQAGKPHSQRSLTAEWEEICRALLR